MKIFFVAIAALSAVPCFARTVDLECTTTVRGSSTAGQVFVFNDTVQAAFETDRSGSLRFFSAFDGHRDLEDAGRIQTRGEALPGRPDYVVFSGPDQVSRGSVALAIPRDALNRPRGSRFTGFFQTTQTDTGAREPLKMNLTMACRVL